MRYFFIEQSEIQNKTVEITGSDAVHINTVLRLQAGNMIGLFDGKGFTYEARITCVSSGQVSASIVKTYLSTAESPIYITVAQAYLQDKKMDGLLRQLTEIGISEWIPFVAKRSIARPGKEKRSARSQRWRRIVKESIKQCKRGRIPEIGAVISFGELLNIEKQYDLKVIFWENETGAMDAGFVGTENSRPRRIFLIMGPEGGFTLEEIEQARTNGFITASLGPRILRADTATIAACTLLQYLFGDMGHNFK